MTTITLTPTQVHELVTALHKNRSKIQRRINRIIRLADTPEEQAKQEANPYRKLYMETICTCREARIKTIDGLLAILEQEEHKNTETI